MSENSIIPIETGLPETLELGKILAASGFFDDVKQAAQAVVKILAGREIGIGPIAAMTGIHIIKGKPAVGAGIIASAIKRSGRYNYRIKQHDNTVCAIEFFERNGDKWESVGISTFTIEDAKKAGTQNLDKYPRNMLFARAISNGARWYTPDIFGGPVYTPEELVQPQDDVTVIDGYTTQATTVTPSPTPDEEFESLPSASAKVQAQVPAKPKSTKLATISTGRFFDRAAEFAAKHPHYQDKSGKSDNIHLCATIAQKLGYDRITEDNLDEIFDKLEEYAKDK